MQISVGFDLQSSHGGIVICLLVCLTAWLFASRSTHVRCGIFIVPLNCSRYLVKLWLESCYYRCYGCNLPLLWFSLILVLPCWWFHSLCNLVLCYSKPLQVGTCKQCWYLSVKRIWQESCRGACIFYNLHMHLPNAYYKKTSDIKTRRVWCF